MDPITTEVYPVKNRNGVVWAWRLYYIIPPSRSEKGRLEEERMTVRQDGEVMNFETREEAVRFALEVLNNPVVNP